MGYNGAKMVREAHVCVLEIKNVSMKIIVRLSTILLLLQPALKYKTTDFRPKNGRIQKLKKI